MDRKQCGWDAANPLRAHPYDDDPVVQAIRRQFEDDPDASPPTLAARLGLTESTVGLALTWINHLDGIHGKES